MKTGFLICGTQKGGTSALDAYCRDHGDIGMAREKELHFFDNDALFVPGPVDYSVYHRSFPSGGNWKILGESTPIYMYWPQAPERIFNYNPRMKIIVVLRNPIERAYSQWQMESGRGNETLSFGEAIRQEKQRLPAATGLQKRAWSYVDRGFYLGQLERLWALFGRDGVLVLRSEALMLEPAAALERVSAFLDIAPFGGVESRRVNAQSYAAPMSERDRAWLSAVYDEEIGRLERALGWDCGNWR